MATGVAGSSKVDESVSAADGNNLSAEVGKEDQILQMIDSGFDEERVFESPEYRMSMEMLEDPRLKGNQMYEKLVVRLSAFYLNTEKILKNGLNEAQLNVIKKSGFTQEYRTKLHKCLREKLIFIVNERNMEVKLRLLRKTYEWFLDKLIAMGALSQ